METKKLYYDDVYCRAFTARVTGCVQEKKTWLVTLDQTAFYPEGWEQKLQEIISRVNLRTSM